ncbi:uncharacterized protein EI97DRAFT_435913 [Westerdykella ornata]|uniref:Uncharacterized protein n=1 Tax=Westerdykella ornata TaxID=318751 RepID=A0A6A6JE80_WESOR|nr:uncharacterized protein EI97DRAFT_435913 [Westerdykella ornata]KAF2273489.1 hypothetical protein EI97DRAFT_435913 [Westerdykella ornata]
MLSIQTPSTSNPQKYTPNLLPARIHHDGPINDPQRYWTPEKDEDGTLHAYFRGRHLHGTSLALPANYTGAVLNITDKQLPPEPQRSHREQSRDAGEEEDDEEEEEIEEVDVRIAERIGEFEEVVVWGHGGRVDEGEDVYVRGVREWIGFAEAVHAEEDEEGEEVGRREGKGE